MEYSGQTTSYSHKTAAREAASRGETITDWSVIEIDGSSALDNGAILRVQWSDCPIEVEEEVRTLWKNEEMHNDSYFSWNRENECWFEGMADPAEGEADPTYASVYPVIDTYLQANEVSEILINWWW